MQGCVRRKSSDEMITGALATVGLLADLDALRGIINVVPHPIFVKDEQHRFVIVNQAMCELMGYTYDELVGRTDADFVPIEEAEVFMANDRRVRHE